MPFCHLQFSQKTNKKIQLYYYGTLSGIVFFRFLGELTTPKIHFEINLPLVGISPNEQKLSIEKRLTK